MTTFPIHNIKTYRKIKEKKTFEKDILHDILYKIYSIFNIQKHF